MSELRLTLDQEQIIVGEPNYKYSVSGDRILNVYITIRHKGLGEFKEISGREDYVLESKLQSQIDKWTEKWEKELEKREKQTFEEQKVEEAIRLTESAKLFVDGLNNTLFNALTSTSRIDWGGLLENDEYAEPMPTRIKGLRKPSKPSLHSLHDIASHSYSFFEKIFPSLKQKKVELLYRENKSIELLNGSLVAEYEESVKNIDKQNLEIEDRNRKAELEWSERKDAFLLSQKERNDEIRSLEAAYLAGEKVGIEYNCQIILSSSDHLSVVPKKFRLDFNTENNCLIIDYEIPDVSVFPRTKEVKYIKSKRELSISYYTDNQINTLYDDFVYKLVLRCVYEILEGDAIDIIQLVSFNGWVNAINKATGKEQTNCIISLTVKKKEFEDINLENVDPRECFKSLKGVSAARLHTLTAIQPKMTIQKDDPRFVDAYEVIKDIESGYNLATMAWEDFEHLVRELFEKEFSQGEAEVKITQASRDGGVDAIIFDPDPIRGGKIVVQAKRYTNVVGVAAVRDLYGTVMNEGANKGILVTTAQYGADSYDFAKNKPLTLIDGGNLLSLLEKHGHKARINLREAKEHFKFNTL